MRAGQRRAVFGVLFLAGAALAASAYYLSLVPATHPDHDHGILNLDAGGRLVVETREGKSRNLVGKPGKVLLLHFLTIEDPKAAEELAALFAFQRKVAADPGVEILTIAKVSDFKTLDDWLQRASLAPPDPKSLTIDPGGATTTRLNSKRPLETMVFTADGKLSSQAKGPMEWGADTTAAIEKARTGASLE